MRIFAKLCRLRHHQMGSAGCEALRNGCPRHYTLRWRGREFSEAELAGFDVESLIGSGCMLSIVHKARDGFVYANVQAVLPLAKGTEVPEPRGHVR